MKPDKDRWQQYFLTASRQAGYDTTNRGWISRLAADLDTTVTVASRWRDGRVPGIDGCRDLARVWGVPILDVMVGAGILTPDEASWADRPTPDQQRLAHVLAVLDDPSTPPMLRNLLATVLDDISKAATQASENFHAE
jgi:hypothetical protein